MNNKFLFIILRQTRKLAFKFAMFLVFYTGFNYLSPYGGRF